MSTFGNLALSLIGTAINGALTNNTGAYYSGSYNNCIFDQASNCCDNTQQAKAASNNRVTWGILGGVLGLAGVAGGIYALCKNANAKEEVKIRISTLNTEINAELAKVGTGVTAADYETKISENKKVISDYEVADKTVTTIKKEIADLTPSIESLKQLVQSSSNEMQTQQAIIKDPNKSEPERLAAQTAYDVAKAKYDKFVKDQGEKEAKLAQLVQEEATEQAKLNALKREYDALSVKTAGEFDTIGASIKAKLAELKELEATHLENADGNELNRKASSNYSDLFEAADSTEVADNVTVTKRAIREAINQYRTSTGEAQKTAATRLQKLWEKAGSDVTDNTTLSMAYEIIAKEANLGK